MRSWDELRHVVTAPPGDYVGLDEDEIDAVGRANLLLGARRSPLLACASVLRLRVSPAAVVVSAPLRTVDGRVSLDELADGWATWIGRTESWAASVREAIAVGLLTGTVARSMVSGTLGASVVRPGPRLIPVLSRRDEPRQRLEVFPW